MDCQLSPLVSVLTPVYNGADFIAECIESVLGQTYRNWEYTIVNNCSTDGSLEIAQRYAAKDPRIRVVSNDSFLRIIENHNHTIRQISPKSKYCKFVYADDWLYPSCIEEMVRIAEEYPSVGLVGAYMMDGQNVLWQGPPYPSPCIPGRAVCRDKLLGGPYVFGTMTSLLLRSDLVRKRSDLFNENNLHADQEACFDLLSESDFGFIHQVLSFSRPRENSNGSFAANFDSVILGELVIFLKYGPLLLNSAEFNRRWKQLGWEYHRVLAHNVLRVRLGEFWKYHLGTLAAYGARVNPWWLTTGLLFEIARLLSHPLRATSRGWGWWSQSLNSALSTILDPLKVRLKGLWIKRADPCEVRIEGQKAGKHVL